MPWPSGQLQEDGQPARSFSAAKSLGSQGVPANSGEWGAAGIRLITETKGQGFTSKLHQTALWAFDPSFSLLCSAFRAAHRPCCRRLPPSATLHLLPSTPPTSIAQSSLRLLRQEQPFSPAWHVAAFCTSALPHQLPPRVRDSCCFFPAGSRPPLWDHPFPLIQFEGI